MPAANDVTTKYYSGQGVVLMATRDVAGNPEGFVPIGNVSALAIAVETSVLEHKESSTGARGIDLRLTQEVKANVKMTMENFSPDNIALGLYGSNATVASGTAVADAITLPVGTMARVGNTTFALANIGVTVTTVVGSTLLTPVLGTDYTVNPEVGSVNIISTANGGGFADGETVTVTYNHTAYNELNALTQSQPERWLRFEGLNTADSANSAVTIDVFKFAANPLAELALVTADIGQIQLDGSALLDNTKTTGSKYFRQRLI